MHSLVAGETGTGKSRVLRSVIVPEWIRRGRPVVVLDPLNQPWGATYQTADPYDFLATMQRSEGCIGIWDECGYMMQTDPELKRSMAWLATVSRNSGHMLYFVSQRFYLVPPTFRLQCTRGFLFRLRGRDCAEAAEMFPDPGLETALPTLGVGECIIVQPMKPPVKTRVF